MERAAARLVAESTIPARWAGRKLIALPPASDDNPGTVMAARILVVDDDVDHATTLQRLLTRQGYDVDVVHHADAALEWLRQGNGAVVLTDLKMPGRSGLDLIRAARALSLDADFVLMTAFATVEHAVEALREGAEDFITKPIRKAALLKVLERLVRRRELEQENARLRAALAAHESGNRMIGTSEALVRARQRLHQAAGSEATVLLLGESGTGKELFAHELHERSPRAQSRLVTLHCAALPESIIESELFGHEAGSFTGARAAKAGLLEQADGGTLFLDEVGEIPPAVQVRLLRVLQNGEVLRVGATRPRHVDVRVVAATHRDLRAMVSAGTFREDLYYRLNVIPIEVPPLRARGHDTLALAEAFLQRFRAADAPLRLGGEARRAVLGYGWPGNVRELENVMQRLAVLCAGHEVQLADLPEELRGAAGDGARPVVRIEVGTPLAEAERRLLLATLDHAGGDKALAASLLGVARRTVYRKLDEYGTHGTHDAARGADGEEVAADGDPAP